VSDRDVLLKKIKRLGYEYVFLDNADSGFRWIGIIPTLYTDGSTRVDEDVFNLLKEYGFEFKLLLINCESTKNAYGYDTMVVFVKNERW